MRPLAERLSELSGASSSTIEGLASLAFAALSEAVGEGEPAVLPAVAEAAARHAAFVERARGAFRIYPVVSSGGFHSGQADPRAFALFATIGALGNAGLYGGEELLARQNEQADGAWLQGEAARLFTIVFVLDRAADWLQSRAVSAAEYQAGTAAAIRSAATLDLRPPIR